MNLTLGILLVITGGALEGLFSLPVTRTPRWQWENIWGLGSLMALILVPWPVAYLTVPQLRNGVRLRTTLDDGGQLPMQLEMWCPNCCHQLPLNPNSSFQRVAAGRAVQTDGQRIL